MRKKYLKLALASKLTPQELKLLSGSFDLVGDIAVVRMEKSLLEKGGVVAEAVMAANKHVKTVLCQVGAVSGMFRLRELEWIAGEKKTETIHREHGCLLHVDLSKVYFSPRLAFERMRVAKQVQPGEVIVNMFAGIGCFSVIIAKHSKASKIFSIDINSNAVRLMRENVRLNHVTYRVIPMEGDAREIIEKTLPGVADRVLMPLPEKSLEYLEVAIAALKPSGGYVHYYSHVHAGKKENSVDEVVKEASKKLAELGILFYIKHSDIVRTVGPNWYQVVLDIQIAPFEKLTANQASVITMKREKERML